MNVSTSSLILSISSPCPSTSASSSKSKKAYLFFIPGTIGKPIIINSHLILHYKLRKGLCHTQIQKRHKSKKYKDIFYFARHLQCNSCIFFIWVAFVLKQRCIVKSRMFQITNFRFFIKLVSVCDFQFLSPQFYDVLSVTVQYI